MVEHIQHKKCVLKQLKIEYLIFFFSRCLCILCITGFTSKRKGRLEQIIFGRKENIVQSKFLPDIS